jgi:hypothetical protein
MQDHLQAAVLPRMLLLRLCFALLLFLRLSPPVEQPQKWFHRMLLQ